MSQTTVASSEKKTIGLPRDESRFAKSFTTFTRQAMGNRDNCCAECGAPLEGKIGNTGEEIRMRTRDTKQFICLKCVGKVKYRDLKRARAHPQGYEKPAPFVVNGFRDRKSIWKPQLKGGS